jgi:hypothetical protein
MNEEILETLKSNIRSKVYKIKNIDECSFENIEKGILSVHAPWSGHSNIYGKSVLSFLNKFEEIKFKIYIIEIDNISLESQFYLFGSACHGYFESLWIEKGKTIFCYKDDNKASKHPDFLTFLGNQLELPAV